MKAKWSNIVVAAIFAGSTNAWAGTSVGPIIVRATVDSAQNINCTILEDNDPGQVVTSMQFGSLVPSTPTGGLIGQIFFQFHCGVASNTGPYQVTQTGGSLTSGGGQTLADGAWIVTPLDGIGGNPSNPFPPGTTLGSCGTAASASKLLFAQTNGTSVSDYSFTYGITDDPANCASDAIPQDQPAGIYGTTVTITLQ